MKKVIGILLVLLLVSTAVFAGGGKEASAGKGGDSITLNYWFASRWKGVTGDEKNAQMGDWQKDVAARFIENNENLEIKCEQVSFADMLEKVSVSVEGGNPPNVVEDGSQRFFTYADKGALIALDDYFSTEELADFIDGAWDLGKYKDGKHYMIPWAGMVIHPVVNVDLFREAGALDLLPLDGERSWTMEEFRAACEAVSKLDGVYGTAFYCGSEQGDSGTNALYWGYGGDLFNEDFSACMFNSPEAIKGVEWALKMVDDGIAAPAPETMTTRDAYGLFINQKIGIYLNGTSEVFRRVENDLKAGGFDTFEMEHVLPPSAVGVDPGFYANPVGLAVFKTGNSEQEKMAVDLAKFATNTENSKSLKLAGLLPVRKSVGNLYPGDKYYDWALDVLKYQRDPGYATGVYNEMRSFLYPELQSIYTHAKTVKEGLDDFAENVNKVILEKSN